MQDLAADFTINNTSPIEFEAEISPSEHFDCSFEIHVTPDISHLATKQELEDAVDTINARIDDEVDTINDRIDGIDAEIVDLTTEVNKKVENIIGDDFINITRNGSAIVINSKTFIFEQAIASNTWIINYDWSYKQPSIDVIDSAGNIQLPNDINYATNTITLSFLAAFTGKAYLN